MHELAITESVVAAVREKLGDAQVTRIRLEIGKLSGVVPDSMRFCFEIAAAGTGLEGAELEIAEPPGRARCRDCSATVELDDLILLCPCGSADLEVLEGMQLLIKNVEVA